MHPFIDITSEPTIDRLFKGYGSNLSVIISQGRFNESSSSNLYKLYLSAVFLFNRVKVQNYGKIRDFVVSIK